MAIKVSCETVVNDDKSAAFQSLNAGVLTTENYPTEKSVGDFFYDSDEKALKVWTGTEWK